MRSIQSPTVFPEIVNQTKNVAFCVTELAKQGYEVQAVHIDALQAFVHLKYTPQLSKLHGLDRGVVDGSGGQFMVREIKLNGIRVQWLVAYFETDKPGVH